MANNGNKRHWQDGLNFVLGFWLIVAPWVLGFADTRIAVGNSVIMGAAVLIVSFTAFITPDIWEEWINLLSGFLLLISPVTTGYTNQTVAVANSVIVGALIVGDAVWDLNRRLKEQYADRGHAANST